MIVVVDDHKIVLKLIQQSLSKEGIESKAFHDPQEALQFSFDHIEDIKLIILDIYMPELDGIEFADAILNVNENLPILMLSSANYDVVLKDERVKNKVHFLRKPYDKEKLIEYVNKLITKDL